jgi:hypothetical protein
MTTPLNAQLGWIGDLIDGEDVSDFALSFPLVRAVSDKLRSQQEQIERLSTLVLEIQNARTRYQMQTESEDEATIKVQAEQITTLQADKDTWHANYLRKINKLQADIRAARAALHDKDMEIARWRNDQPRDIAAARAQALEDAADMSPFGDIIDRQWLRARAASERQSKGSVEAEIGRRLRARAASERKEGAS